MSYLNGDGYRMVKAPADHPKATQQGFIKEQILVVEKALGKRLPNWARIHHVNEIKTDNRPTNLVVYEGEGYHRLLHRRAAAYRATGNPQIRRCHYCSVWILPTDPELRIRSSSRQDGIIHHLKCEREHQRKARARRKT